MACPLGQQRARQPTWTGADLDDVEPGERLGGPSNPPRQVHIEKKILAEPMLRRDTMARNDISQRRQHDCCRCCRVAQPAASERARRVDASVAASRSAAIRLPARATPFPAIPKAVP